MGLKPDHVAWVPSNGAAPAMQDLAADGLDLVTCSVPEARAIIEAGKARSLAVMAAERNPAFKDVPTLKEAMGIDYTTGAWRGFAAPKGLPADIASALTAALKKVNEAAEFREFMANRGFGIKWADGAGFAKFMDDGNKAMGVAMKAAGLAKSLSRKTAGPARLAGPDFHPRSLPSVTRTLACNFPIASQACSWSPSAAWPPMAARACRRSRASRSAPTSFRWWSASASSSAAA